MIEEKDILELGKYIQRLKLLELEVIKATQEAFNTTDALEVYYTSHLNFGSDTVKFQLFFEKEAYAQTIKLHGYEAVKLSVPIPAVQKGNFDSHRLDQLLSKIDWNLPKEHILRNPENANVYKEVLHYAQHQDQEISQTAQLLMLKHWKNKSVEYLIENFPDSGPYETAMFFPLNKHRNDINTLNAYNLLCGRAVLQAKREGKKMDDLYWITISSGKLVTVDGFDIDKALNKQHIQKPESENLTIEMLHSIVSGSLTKATFLYKGHLVQGLIHADPLSKGFALCDENGKPLAEVNRANQRQRNQVDKPDFLSGSTKGSQRKRNVNKGKGI